MTEANRKPRIALMGEFSSGKSTLSNLLLGSRPLPEKVTATRLSPVWMAQGTQPGYRIDVDGSQEPVDINHLEGIDVDATRVIRLFFEAEILQVCDLIDFPGISDPNMSSDVWQRMLNEVDAILWCTHATQAWRQSEAAVWETVPDAVKARSMLLVTKFDKLHSERDRSRVLARLMKEAGDKFDAIFPISLTRALAAGEDFEAFTACGGAAFLERLIDQIGALHEEIGETSQSLFETSGGHVPQAVDGTEADTPAEMAAPEDSAGFETIEPFAAETEIPAQDSPAFGQAEPAADSADTVRVEKVESSMPVDKPDANPDTAPRIIPRRVRPKAATLSARPSRRPASAPNLAYLQDEALMTSSASDAPEDASELRTAFRVKSEAS